MEFVVQEAAKKVLDEELLRARQLRQKQVRQQASQWSEERTRRFEQEKLRQKMEMAQQVTQQVQQYAKDRIEHLLTAHDLAVAEVGGAHRAAAKLREAEVERKRRAEELKVLAQLRGDAASRARLDNQKKEMEKRNENVRRREEVRKEEDRKTREFIEASKSKKEMEATKSNKELPEAVKSSKIHTQKESTRPILNKPVPAAVGRSSRSVLPGIREPRKDAASGRMSPDAWNKAEGVRKLSLQRDEEKAKRQEELFRRAKERGKVALKKAALEKRLTSLKTKLMSGEGEDAASAMGTGRQIAMLGLGNGSNTKKPIKAVGGSSPILLGTGTGKGQPGIRELGKDAAIGGGGPVSSDVWDKVGGVRKLSLQQAKGRTDRHEERLQLAEQRDKVVPNQTAHDKPLMDSVSQLISGEEEDAAFAMGTGGQISMPTKPVVDDQFSEMSDGDISDIESIPDSAGVSSPVLIGTGTGKGQLGIREPGKNAVIGGRPISPDKEDEAAFAMGTGGQISMPIKPVVDDQFSEMSESDISDIESIPDSPGEIFSVLLGTGIGKGHPGIREPEKDAVIGGGPISSDTWNKNKEEVIRKPSLLPADEKARRVKERNKIALKKGSLDKRFTSFKSKLMSEDAASEMRTGRQIAILDLGNGNIKKSTKAVGGSVLLGTSKVQEIKEPVKVKDAAIGCGPISPDGESEDAAFAMGTGRQISTSTKQVVDDQFSEMSDGDISDIDSDSGSPGVKRSKISFPMKVAASAKPEPDGPYTSTPDGAMTLKKPISRSVAVAVSKKDLVLHTIVSGFLTRRMESIEQLQVSSSSSSNLHIDSTMATRSPTSEDSSTFQSPIATSNEYGLTQFQVSSSSFSNVRVDSKLVTHSLTTRDSSTFHSPIATSSEYSHSTHLSFDKNENKEVKRATRTDTWHNLLVARTLAASTDTDGETSPISSGRGGRAKKTKSETTADRGQSNLFSTSSSMRLTGVSGSETTSGNGNTASGTDSSHKSSQTLAEAKIRTTILESSTSSSSSKSNSASANNQTSTSGSDAITNTMTGSPSSIPSGSSNTANDKNDKKEVKRATIRNFVGPELSDSTEFFSPIYPRPGTAAHRQETPTSPHGIAETKGQQEDVVASIFDQLQCDFAGLMSIERPPWLVQ